MSAATVAASGPDAGGSGGGGVDARPRRRAGDRDAFDRCGPAGAGGGSVVDGRVVDRLRALLAEPLVRELGAQELVIDLSEVRVCEPGLVRFLHRVRLRRLAAGCRMELRNPSEALGVGLEDATLSEVFTVYDAVRRHVPR